MGGLTMLECLKWVTQRARSGGKSLGLLVLSASLLVGCGTEGALSDEDARSAEQEISIAQARVLGFEAPTQDWSSDSGAVISASTTVTQGTRALSVTPNGGTQLSSVAIRAPGQARTTATLDVRLGTTVNWGEIRLVIKSPSQGQYWLDVGGQSLVGKVANTFHTLSFPLSTQARAILNSSASDLTFVIAYNGPASVSLTVDKLLVSNDTTVTPPGPGTPEEFAVTIPSGTVVGNVFLSGTEKLTIDDRVTLGENGKLPVAYAGGIAQSRFASEVQAHVNVHAKANNLYLASQSHTFGSIRTGGTVTQQDGSVQVDGGVVPSAVAASPLTWTVKWPGGGEGDIALPVDAPNKNLAPGRYAKVAVAPRAALTFRSGDYYLDELRVEPQATIYINAHAGPVRIYTRTTLHLNVGVTFTAGQKGDLFLGHLGTSPAYFEEAIVATVVAPQAAIELRRPASGKPHEGSFFGKSIHVLSDSTVLHIPNNFDFLCPTGDFDGDEVLDCFDSCWNDPDKTEPGVCGCNRPDIDRDGDGVADCEDGAPDDPTTVFVGDCGDRDPVTGAITPAPAGKRCDDGICSGYQTCDGAGTCGDPNSCKPHPSCRYIYANSTDKWYWICDAQVDRQTAVNYCDSIPGSKLARIPSSGIGQLIKNNATTDVWIGANATAQAGEWRWRTYTGDSGTHIWTGGPTGRPVHGRYNGWASPPATAARCAYLNQNGTWVAAGCGEQHGFVCEVSNDRLGGGGEIGIGDDIEGPEDIIGIPPYQGPSDNCIPESEATATYTEADIAYKMRLCQACLEESTDCDGVCDGALSVPDPTARCANDDDHWLLSAPSCETGDLPLAVDGGGNTIDCTGTEDCEPLPRGGVCKEHSDCTGAGERCFQRTCVLPLVCDTVRSKCVVPATSCGGDGPFTDICEDIEICEPSIEQEPDDELDDEKLAESPPTPENLFGTSEVPEPEDPVTFPVDPCAVDGACGSIKDAYHPWCRIDMSDNDPIPPADTSAPGSPTAEPKRGGNKDGNAQFYFDPIFNFRQSAALGVLGLPDIDIHAEAGVGAGVKIGFLPKGKKIDFSLIDAWAGLDADECGVSGGARLVLLGEDLIGSVTSDYLPLNAPSAEARAQCQELLSKIKESADRVKKALHDATELLRQYKEVRLAGKTFPPDLCRLIAPDSGLPRGFPAGDCPATGPTETPEQTIQRFIDYYVATIEGFGDKKVSELAFSLKDYVSEFATTVKESLGEIGGEFQLFSYKDKTNTTIVTTQFFIGPVPAFLELGATLDFGIVLNARAGLRVGDFAQQVLDLYSKEAKSTEVAYAGLAGNPYAGAGAYLFTGVGFSIPGFKVQLGIQGELRLGTVYIPAYAGAGLLVGTRPDGRGIPDTFKEFAEEGAYLIPPRIYSVQAGYTAGLEARIRDLVSGSIAAKLKLKLLFFSKTWSRTLLSFKGFCPTSKNGPDGSQPGCDYPIFRAEGELVAAEGEFGLGQVKMPITFPKLSLARVQGEIEAALSQNPAPEEDEEGDDEPEVASFNEDARVGQLFFDKQCATCMGPGYNDRPEDQCFSNQDCCGQTSICYLNQNYYSPNFEKRGCRECLPIDETPGFPSFDDVCNSDADCCRASETTPGKCGRWSKCTTGECDAPCDNDSQCNEGFLCDQDPDSPFMNTCQIPGENGVPDYRECHPIVVPR